MKKIFAIALALVMVLSMASAFAMYCDADWGWACATASNRCGKAKVEVVEYVRGNSYCESEFVASNCAAAVVGERVYYAVKLTVDADVNETWWNTAKANKLVLGFTNLSFTNGGAAATTANVDLPDFDTVKKGGVWYLKNDATSTWVKEDANFSFGADYVNEVWALKPAVKVCATLKSAWDGIGTTVIGKYTVNYNGTDKFYVGVNGSKYIDFALDGDYKIVKASVVGAPGSAVITGYAVDGSTFVDVNGKAYGFTCNEGAFLKEVLDFFGLDFQTCMTKDAVKKNFGWDDTFKACTDYSDKGMAVVDTECVVAIPKTGDMSVLAWLF